MKKEEIKISENEMLEALERSGYILESAISKQLVTLGYEIESNFVTIDPITGNNREIDIFAQIYDESRSGGEKEALKLIASTWFVMEIKNNNSPFVLLTEFEFKPDSRVHGGLKLVSTIPSDSSFIDYFGYPSFHIDISDRKRKIYTQYCSFSRKNQKNELMASHPDNLYSDILKIVNYCEEMVESWEDNDFNMSGDDYLRNFLYLPVLVINDDLFELNLLKRGGKRLTKVSYSKLAFGYRYKSEPKVAIVYIVTKEGLEDFLSMTRKMDMQVEEMMLESKKRDLEPKK